MSRGQAHVRKSSGSPRPGASRRSLPRTAGEGRWLASLAAALAHSRTAVRHLGCAVPRRAPQDLDHAAGGSPRRRISCRCCSEFIRPQRGSFRTREKSPDRVVPAGAPSHSAISTPRIRPRTSRGGKALFIPRPSCEYEHLAVRRRKAERYPPPAWSDASERTEPHRAGRVARRIVARRPPGRRTAVGGADTGAYGGAAGAGPEQAAPACSVTLGAVGLDQGLPIPHLAVHRSAPCGVRIGHERLHLQGLDFELQLAHGDLSRWG